MSVTVLSDTTPVARKHHQCMDCGGFIAPGQRYNLQKNVFDGRAYAWKQHIDCRQMSLEATREWYFDEGIPPLTECDDVMESLDAWRGKYPHVVCRIEFRKQTAEARRQKRPAAAPVQS